MNGPLRPGQQIDLTIDSLALGGDGVARHDGQVVFVPFVGAGERVRIKIVQAHRSFARGEVLQVLELSPHREVPPCPYYQTCGGCQYQHLTYAEELRWKENQVRETFRRLAKIPEIPLQPIIPCPSPYGYRNRITVHSNGQQIGFHQAGSSELVDIDQCLLADPAVNETLKHLRATRPTPGHYSLRHPSLPPSAFFQINQPLLEILTETVVQACAGSATRLVEGYCGGGFFTRRLAASFREVIAIENDARALRDAERLGLTHVTWHCGRVEDFLHGALQSGGGESTVVLVDPPREGLGDLARRALLDYPVQQVVYVSCDPATLARDAKALQEIYRLESVQPIDLFPRTAQIECVTKWQKR